MSSNHNPELMIIGDSLAQGARSLSVKRKYCREAYPTIAANIAGINDFFYPRHPREVLIDLEAIADQRDVREDVKRRCRIERVNSVDLVEARSQEHDLLAEQLHHAISLDGVLLQGRQTRKLHDGRDAREARVDHLADRVGNRR